MEANRGQNGIQLLLTAEKEAQHIVNAARTGRSRRQGSRGESGDEEEWRSRDEEREQENRGDRETGRERRRRSTKMIDQQSRRSVKERRLSDRSIEEKTLESFSTLSAKMARLKQAKEEAEKEIAEFRAQMEAQFQRKVAESSGDSGANVKRLEQETEAKIHHLNTEAARISHDIAHMLLRHVTTVKN